MTLLQIGIGTDQFSPVSCDFSCCYPFIGFVFCFLHEKSYCLREKLRSPSMMKKKLKPDPGHTLAVNTFKRKDIYSFSLWWWRNLCHVSCQVTRWWWNNSSN